MFKNSFVLLSLGLGLLLGLPLQASDQETETTSVHANHLPGLPFTMPDSFESFKAITAYLEHECPADVTRVQGATQTYAFVVAYPYSGMDTSELFCFAEYQGKYALFLQASLWKTPPGIKKEYKIDGNFVDIVCNGKTILKIDAPRAHE